MNAALILSIVIIGFAAGLRALTPPAIIAWAAFAGFIDLSATPFYFMESPLVVAITSILALGEYIGDIRPSAPDRTSPPGLIARFVTGSFSAACLLAASGTSLLICLLGGIAAAAGAFVGMQLRKGLVRRLAIKDVFIAIPEDAVSIALTLLAIALS